MDNQHLLDLALGGIVSVLWWLLKNKDAVQADQIKTLFDKHEEDAQRLQDLELNIAQRHYVKEELDSRFNKLEVAFIKGFDGLGIKIDRISEVLLNRK